MACESCVGRPKKHSTSDRRGRHPHRWGLLEQPFTWVRERRPTCPFGCRCGSVGCNPLTPTQPYQVQWHRVAGGAAPQRRATTARWRPPPRPGWTIATQPAVDPTRSASGHPDDGRRVSRRRHTRAGCRAPVVGDKWGEGKDSGVSVNSPESRREKKHVGRCGRGASTCVSACAAYCHQPAARLASGAPREASRAVMANSRQHVCRDDQASNAQNNMNETKHAPRAQKKKKSIHAKSTRRESSRVRQRVGRGSPRHCRHSP